MLSIEELEKFYPEKRPRSDIGASSLFADVWRGRLVYVIERKSFYTYIGKVWKKDIDDLKTHELAKEFALSIVNYFSCKEHENEDAVKWYSKYFTRDKRVRLINDTKSIDPKSVSEFDKQPYMFNCQNCTVNLLTGEASMHDPYDYLSKISNVWYEPEAESEELNQFFVSIMDKNSDLINYLQEALGYSMTSGTFQECFFITYGSSTRNGKGTLNNTMIHMLGDYARAASYETFESKKYRNSSGANEDVARLAGARYVSVSEPSEGMTLDSALIKTLSGNDVITARRLYEGSFEFTASFKIWINTNHLPNITDDTVFKSNRVQLIPFNKHFNENKQDRGLKARLIKKENISALFNWCMEGFQRMASRGGLQIPDVIRQEIEKYEEQNDRIGAFMHECFRKSVDQVHRIKMSEVYKVYKWWLNENGYAGALSRRKFKQKLSEKNVCIEPYIGQDCMIGYEKIDIIPEHLFL